MAFSVQIRLGPGIGEEWEPANLYLTLSHFEYCSVLPTHATSGCIYTTLGIVSYVAVSRAYIFRRGDAFLFRLVGEYRSESDITDTSDVRNVGVELVSITILPRGSTSMPIFSRLMALICGLWPIAARTTSVSTLWTSGYGAPLANERLRTTHRLLLAALRSLHRDDHLPNFFLCRKDFVPNLKFWPCLVNDFWNCSSLPCSQYALKERNTENIKINRRTKFPRRRQHPSTIEELDDCNFRAQTTPRAIHLQSNNTTTDNNHLTWYLLE